MRRIESIDHLTNSVLDRSWDRLDEIEDQDVATSLFSEFPQHLNEMDAHGRESVNEPDALMGNPPSQNDETQVSPLRRRLYSPTEIKKTIALEELHLQSLLNRATHH